MGWMKEEGFERNLLLQRRNVGQETGRCYRSGAAIGLSLVCLDDLSPFSAIHHLPLFGREALKPAFSNAALTWLIFKNRCHTNPLR